jgi:hypothetical protein
LAIQEVTLVELRALLAQAHGDEVAYRDLSGSLPEDGHRLGL